jgi:hypothetical protein
VRTGVRGREGRSRTGPKRDPIPGYARTLLEEGILGKGELDAMKAEAERIVEAEARAVIEAPWPDAAQAGAGVVANEPARVHVEPLDNADARFSRKATLPPVEEAPPFDPKGSTFLEAVMQGWATRSAPIRASSSTARTSAGGTGTRSCCSVRSSRSTATGSSTRRSRRGACSRVRGGRPRRCEADRGDPVQRLRRDRVQPARQQRGEDPVPVGRVGADVVRMPWGGLRRAGPYHSQNTEAWFYRTPGLKIVCPATPHDARALMAAAVADPDPVLYYEHIALYRDPKVKQRLGEAPPAIPLGRAALRRAGRDLALVSYGAYVHLAMRVASALEKDGVDCAVSIFDRSPRSIARRSSRWHVTAARC